MIGLALLAGTAASAQAAPIKSQGPANASATGIANANGNSVLASGVTTSNGNGKNSGSATSSGSNSASNSSAASNGNGNGSSNGAASSSNGNSSSNGSSASSNASSNSAASNGGSNSSSNGSSASNNASFNGNGNNSDSASAGATGGVSGGTTVLAAPAGALTYGVDALAAAAAANDFFGLVSGNDSKGIDGLNLSWGSGWTLAAKDNTDSSTDVANVVDGVLFQVNAGAKAVSGSWTLSGTGDMFSTGPILMDMVAVLKSSTEYGLYYFENLAFDGSGGGDWLSPSFNAQGMRQELSHLSIYVRFGGGMSMPGGATSGGLGGSAGTPVPEPGSLALASLGLAALGWARRKSARHG